MTPAPITPATWITLFRIALIVPICWLILVPGVVATWAAVALYLVAAASDGLDGWVARRFRQVSVFGAMLDQIADKLMVAAVMVALVAAGRVASVHIVAAIAIILRELLVSGLREHLAAIGVGLPVSRLGKWKTAAQMTALGIVVTAPAAPAWVGWLGLGLLWLAAAITMVSGGHYLAASFAHLTGAAKPVDDPSSLPERAA